MRNISVFTSHDSPQMVVSPNINVMGRRVIATLLDFIPFGILIVLVDSTFGINQYLASLSPLPGIPYASSTAVAWPWLYLMMITYYTAQEALFSTTIGKSLMGLKVVRDDGSPITFKNALVRNIVRPIDAIWSYLLGWILALCSSRHRRLGDHLAGTLVASADSVPMFSLRRSSLWLRVGTLAILCTCFIAFCLSFDYYGRPSLVVHSLTNVNAPSPIFTKRGTITDLTLSQPIWKDNTVSYAFTFYAYRSGVMSNCSGNITLTWSGFLSGWGESSGDAVCNPAAASLK
ncbi:MAG: RDD family protein [Ktedonobacteraceae bacterium]|nr:RDD family protein [Ktedonobacteraceae bacterium]